MIYFLNIFIFRAPSFSSPHLPCLVSACLLVCSVLIFDPSSLCFIVRLTPALGGGGGGWAAITDRRSSWPPLRPGPAWRQRGVGGSCPAASAESALACSV